jgi:hypothetical protein
MAQADSTPLIRYDRATKQRDTVGYVRTPRNNTQVSGGADGQRVTVGMANPFTPRDEWVVTSDGRVAVIRSPEYRVDWTSPARSQGGAIAYPRIKVTEKHKETWRETMRGATMMMMTAGPSGQVSTRTGPPARGSVPEPGDWPEVLPPFLANSAFAAPDGRVWVNRTRRRRRPAARRPTRLAGGGARGCPRGRDWPAPAPA